MARAAALIGEGRLDEAKTICQQVLDGNSDNGEAIYAMAWISFCRQDHEDALARFQRVIELNPQHARAHNNIGTILMTAGDHAGASRHLEAAIEATPDFSEAYCNLGAVRMSLGEPKAARIAFEKVTELEPGDPIALSNLAAAKIGLGEIDQAITDYEKVVSLKPDLAEAHNNLAQALRQKRRFDDAAASFERCLAVRPDYADAHANLGNMARELGRLDEAVASYRGALALRPDFSSTRSNLIYALKLMAETSSSEIKAEADRFGAMVRSKADPFIDWKVERDPEKRLRVGMVSGDFCAHVVARYLESFLHHMDRSRVEFFAYSNTPKEDDATARLKPNFAHWRKVVGLDDARLANQIHDDEVDILIDLSGHSALNRLPMFAYRPAPVQATWLGLFATSGVPGMDYIIADPYLAPGDEAQYFTEKIWPLAESWLCLEPPDITIEPGPLPALGSGTITFGCFNNLAKMTDRVVALWARVLAAIPGSNLFLKARDLADAPARQNILDRFGVHGIGAERLVLEAGAPLAEYFAAYGRVDVALDPFPFHGATTSLDGLWMGVPVLTKRGDRMGTHLGESIAHAAGLSDWIADGEDDYVDKAVALTSDLGRLAELRAGLRDRILATSLYDGARFAKHFDDALRGMWRSACDH